MKDKPSTRLNCSNSEQTLLFSWVQPWHSRTYQWGLTNLLATVKVLLIISLCLDWYYDENSVASFWWYQTDQVRILGNAMRPSSLPLVGGKNWSSKVAQHVAQILELKYVSKRQGRKKLLLYPAVRIQILLALSVYLSVEGDITRRSFDHVYLSAALGDSELRIGR